MLASKQVNRAGGLARPRDDGRADPKPRSPSTSGRRSRRPCENRACPPRSPVVVCQGDETGQELLDEALRVLEPNVIGFPVDLASFDLSLEARRRTANGVVHDAASAMRETGLGLKAATITPPGVGDVGSPNRILREGVGGSVILRTGRRIPGVSPLAPMVHPVAVVRMATGDAYGAEEGRMGDGARSTSRPTAPRRSPGVRAGRWPSTPSGWRPRWGRRSTGVPNGRCRPATRPCSKRRWTRRPLATLTSTTAPF